MIKFKTLTIQNFLSYGNAPILLELDNIGTTLIIGEDLDNTASGTGANGVGKTTWVNALIYALYGKPLSNISMDNLINNINKKNMRVEVEFEKNDKIITVRRARKEKGLGNYAKVFVRPIGTALDESTHDETPDSVSNINDYIIDYLGIPYELFIRIVTFTATHTPFLDLTLRQQLDIMEELFSLTQLSIKAELLKSKMKDTKQSLEIKIKHNEQLEKEHERHNTQLDSAKRRVDDWEKDRDDDIVIAKAQLIKHEVVPVKEQEKLYKRVEKLKNTLVKEGSKQKDIETFITEINAAFTVTRTHLATLEKEKGKILSWKEENTTKIVEYKAIGDNLPEESILRKQEQLHANLETLTDKLETLKVKKREHDANIKTAEDDIKATEDELVHLENAKCPYCAQRLEDANTNIDKCKDTIKIKDQELFEFTVLLDVVQKNIVVTSTDIDVVKNDIKYSMNEINGHLRSRDDCVKKLEELLNEKCPHGDKSAIGDMNDLISELNAEATQLKSNLSDEADKLVKMDDVIEELDKELELCEGQITIGSLDELYEIKNKITQYKNKVKDLKDETNPYLISLKELEDLVLDPIDMESVNDLNNLITHQNYMVKLLTKKDSFIRKALLNKNVAFLNQRLQHYLAALGLPHKVEFTHEMTANISQFGRELDFGNLSSGQKARVNLGLAFSFRDVLQKSHDSINVCMLDEVLDVGLDSVGVQNAARMLKHKARQEDLALYIISHRDEVSNIFDNRMVVQMEKGFSSIKVEE